MLRIHSLHRFATLGLLLLALAGPSVSHAATAVVAEIEYASPDQSVWTIRTDPGGMPVNPLLRVADALFGRAGMAWRSRTYPASRLFLNLQEGTSHFSMLVRAPALADCCLFSRKPLTSAEIRVYRRAGTPSVRAREDLAGKSVIVIRGYSYGGLAAHIADERHRIVSEATNSHQSAIRMLERGRADYLVDYAGPAAEAMAAEGVSGLESDLLVRQDVYLVLSKRYPDAAAVMARLEAIADTLDIEALMRQGR